MFCDRRGGGLGLLRGKVEGGEGSRRREWRGGGGRRRGGEIDASKGGGGGGVGIKDLRGFIGGGIYGSL